MSIRLLAGDCRELLPELPPAFADCVIADPPYGDTSLDWDRKVHGWVPHIARALKPNGSLWVFGSMRFLAALFFDLEAAGFKYAQDVVWEKQNGTGFHADRFKRVHEHAIHFYRGPWADVYKEPQFSLDATKRTVRRKQRPAHMGHIERGSFVSEDGGPRMLRSVIYSRNEHGNAIHPTQKPVELVFPLVAYSCPRGGVLLSPFAGSGTDGIAAKMHGCDAILIEKDAAMAEKAQARITGDMPLFTPVVTA